MNSHKIRTAGVFLFFVGCVSCGGTGELTPCRVNADCGEAFACDQGECLPTVTLSEVDIEPAEDADTLQPTPRRTVAADIALQFGEVCGHPMDCASHLCGGLTSSGSGMCTVSCEPGGCPGGYSCISVGAGTESIVDVCMPASL